MCMTVLVNAWEPIIGIGQNSFEKERGRITVFHITQWPAKQQEWEMGADPGVTDRGRGGGPHYLTFPC